MKDTRYILGEPMKEWQIMTIGLVAAILVVGTLVYGMRWINQAATPITVHEVEPGVRCATMVTTDGAAISCWTDQSRLLDECMVNMMQNLEEKLNE